MHKRNFSLTTGECLNDDSYGVISFEVKVDGDDLLLLLPESDDLDAVIGTSKWMIRQATAELLDRGGAREENGQSAVEIVGPDQSILAEAEGREGGAGCTSGCGDAKLEW